MSQICEVAPLISLAYARQLPPRGKPWALPRQCDKLQFIFQVQRRHRFVIMVIPPETKNAPDRELLSCQGRITTYPRCHLVFAGDDPARLRDACTSPATDVCPHVAEYSGGSPFDCALGGPFDRLFLIRLSAARTLCGGIATVISASTVFDSIACIIAHGHLSVNRQKHTKSSPCGKFVLWPGFEHFVRILLTQTVGYVKLQATEYTQYDRGAPHQEYRRRGASAEPGRRGKGWAPKRAEA